MSTTAITRGAEYDDERGGPSHDECSRNTRVEGALPNNPPYAARRALADSATPALAREVLAMDADAYRAAR